MSAITAVRGSFAAVLATASACLVPAGAAGQDPTPYGGGRLEVASTLPLGYHPTVGIALAPRAGGVALRFDTTLRCGGDVYVVTARALAPLSAGHLSVAGRGHLPLGRGRVTWHWSLTADVGTRGAAGVLTVGGRRRVGSRSTSCSRAPRRPFRALVASAPSGPPASPHPGGSYLGLSGVSLGGGLRGPVVLRVMPSGKVAARWTVAARCGRGSAERLTNLTPATTVAANGSFHRAERFSQRFSDAVVRYRAFFGGRFTSDGAAGTLRLRARVYDRGGRRLLTRCDTTSKRWSALLDSTAASAPSPTGSPVLAPWDPNRFVQAGAWSLTMTSDAAEGILQGQSVSYSTADGPSYGKGGATFLEFNYPNDAGAWDAVFRAPPGGTLSAGGTYYDNDRATEANGGPPRTSAELEVSGRYTSCDTATGSFTIEALAFDPNGALRTAKVRFEHHCDAKPEALRGTWEFHAP